MGGGEGVGDGVARRLFLVVASEYQCPPLSGRALCRPPPLPWPHPSAFPFERTAVAVLLAQTPDNGGTQAGGISPPFTVCGHSWFEVCGAWGGVETPDSGDAQAGGVSPPFTVCARSWFEVWGGV